MIGLIGPETNTVYAPIVPTPELQDALDDMYDTGRLSELIDPYALLEPLHAYFPTPPPTDWPRPRLNTLYWPVVGLAHYAFTTLLVDEYTLNVLRAQMATAGTNAISVTLIDTLDGSGTPNPIPMYFLASRPLVRNGTDPLIEEDSVTTPMDAWVVTLVDERYYILTTQVSSLTVDSWADLFDGLGVTVGDAVVSAYQTPSKRWVFEYYAGRSAAWLADCAAMSVGSRIVTIPGGSPTLQRPTSTNATTLAEAHAVAVIDLRFAGGGPIEAEDTEQSLPDDCAVSFGIPTESTPTQTGTAGIAHWADLAAATSGQSTLGAQWYDDWVTWNSGYTLYDTLYDGFVSVPQSGFLWAVVWEHTSTVGTTRFVRPPHWYGFARAPEVGSSGEECDSCCAFTNPTVNGSPAPQFTLINNPCDPSPTDPVYTQTLEYNGGNTSPPSLTYTNQLVPGGTSSSIVPYSLQLVGTTSGTLSSKTEKVLTDGYLVTATQTTSGTTLINQLVPSDPGGSGNFIYTNQLVDAPTSGNGYTNQLVLAAGKAIEYINQLVLSNGTTGIVGSNQLTVSGTGLLQTGTNITLTGYTIDGYQPLSAGLTSLGSASASNTGLLYLSAPSTFAPVTLAPSVTLDSSGTLAAPQPFISQTGATASWTTAGNFTWVSPFTGTLSYSVWGGGGGGDVSAGKGGGGGENRTGTLSVTTGETIQITIGAGGSPGSGGGQSLIIVSGTSVVIANPGYSTGVSNAGGSGGSGGTGSNGAAGTTGSGGTAGGTGGGTAGQSPGGGGQPNTTGAAGAILFFPPTLTTPSTVNAAALQINGVPVVSAPAALRVGIAQLLGGFL